MRASEAVFLRFILALTIAGGFPSALDAQSAVETTPRTAWYESIDINGFLSAAYSYNFNRPDSMQNRYHVFDFTDNSMKVDVVELSLKKDAVKLYEAGFRIDLTAGSSIPRIARSSGLDIGDLDFHQMYFSFVAPVGRGLKLDFGKFITSMGYEVIEGYDGYNDNYSRSFLFGYAIPFTHTGIKASCSFNENLSAMLMVVNGWDNAVDSNRSKSLCGQMGISPLKGLSLSANYMYGPEKTHNDSDDRSLLDIVGTYAASDLVTIGANGDYGTEQRSAVGGATASWIGAAGYLRLNVSHDFSLCMRAEQFEDKDGLRTGTAQILRELTLTPEYRPQSHFVLRADARFDKSDRDVFESGKGASDSQTTVALDALFTF